MRTSWHSDLPLKSNTTTFNNETAEVTASKETRRRSYFPNSGLINRLGNFILENFYVASKIDEKEVVPDEGVNEDTVGQGTTEDDSRVYPPPEDVTNSTADQEIGEEMSTEERAKVQTGALKEDVTDFEKVKNVGEFFTVFIS